MQTKPDNDRNLRIDVHSEHHSAATGIEERDQDALSFDDTNETSAQNNHPAQPRASRIGGIVALVALATVSVAVPFLFDLSALSPLLLAVLLGMAVGNFGTVSPNVRDGARAVAKPALQAAIVLLGLQITVSHLLEFGLAAIAITLAVVAGTFAFTMAMARLLGVDRAMAQLIGAGTAICGASAIIAANSVARAPREDVAYALGSITLFGSVAMIAYPPAAELIGLTDFSYGLWTGLSIHEVGQVVVAGFQFSDQAGEFATTAKLGRVVLLAPLIVALGMIGGSARTGDGGTRRFVVPWFIAGFLAMIALNSLLELPAGLLSAIKLVTTFLFAIALAGIGLDTELTKIRGRSTKPLQLAAASALFISVLSLILISMFQG